MHKHAELMVQYAQDAMNNECPWELWEVWSGGMESGGWLSLETHPDWDVCKTYRRSPWPHSLKVDGQTLNFARGSTASPEIGSTVHTVYFDADLGRFKTVSGEWVGVDSRANLYAKAGFVFDSVECALSLAAALNLVAKGSIK